MQKLTKDEEINQVKSNLDECKTLVDSLGLDWINERLLKRRECARATYLLMLNLV